MKGKVEVGSGTRFSWKSSGQCYMFFFFAFFSGVLDWIVLILVWFERSLHSAQVSGQSCPWPLKLMTSQAVERTWIRTGSLRSLRYCLGGRDNTASYAGYRTGGSGANRLKKKLHFLFKCQSIWHEKTNWWHCFNVSSVILETGPLFYVVIRATRRSSHL